MYGVGILDGSLSASFKPPNLSWALVSFLATIAAALVGLRLQADGIGVVWPAAGVIVGLAVLAAPPARAHVLIGAFVALCFGNFSQGRSLSASLVFMAGNLGQAAAIALILDRMTGARFHLGGFAQGRLFFVVSAAVVAAVAAAAAIGLRAAGHAHGTFVAVWWLWMSSHLAGILIAAPLIMILGVDLAGMRIASIARRFREAPLTIRQRLLLLAMALAVPLNLLLVASLVQLSRSERASEVAQLDYVARSLGAAVDAHIARHVALAEALASSPALLDPRLDRFEEEARRAMRNVADAWVLVADVDGGQLMNLAASSGEPLPRRHPEALAAQAKAFERRAPVVSDVHLGPVPLVWMVTIEVPIFKAGRPFRVLAIMVRASGFAKLLNAHRIPPGWLAAVIDARGNFVARTRNHDGNVGKSVSPRLRNALATEQVFEGRTVEGDRTVAATAASQSSAWTTAVGVTERELFAPMLSMVRLVSLVGGCISLVSILLAVTLARTISQPMNDLRAAAATLIAGGKPVLRSVTPEVAELWRALENAVASQQATMLRLQDSEARLRLALQAGNLGVHDFDPRTGIIQWDRMTRRLWGVADDVPVTFEMFLAGVHPEDRARVQEAVKAALAPAGSHRYAEEYRVVNAVDGSIHWVRAEGDVAFEDGSAARLVGTVRDITMRRANEDHRQLLMRELAHRSKNMLALVQAVSRQTTAADVDEFRTKLGSRLIALASSLDLLVSENWRGVQLDTLVRSQLVHFGDSVGKRIGIEGGPVTVSASAAQTIGMALHELATNASKYGALANDVGTVSIVWRVASSGSGPRFEIEWIERGGSPPVTPTRKGFGSFITGRMAEHALGASICSKFGQDGLSWHLSCPLARVSSVEPLSGRYIAAAQHS